MELELKIAGQNRRLRITRKSKETRFILDGEEISADVCAISEDVFSILLGGEAFEARVEKTPAGLRVHVDGREYPVTISDPRMWRRHGGALAEAEGLAQVLAPMPGKILRMLAKAGDEVSTGQGLMVVEAMKMQNEVKSPKYGKVEKIAVREGQAVSAGEILAVIS